MSEVTQTILQGGGSGRLGNCLQAAVASALDLPLDDVPHFLEADEDWWTAMVDFLSAHGHVAHKQAPLHGAPPLGLAIGLSPRDWTHAVLCRDGAQWDPHPSRAGLTEVGSYVAFEAAS
jgi:hypothetical protein